MYLDSCKGTILCIALNLQIDNASRKEMAGSRDRKSPWLPFTNGFFDLFFWSRMHVRQKQ